jgi:hypothetical protein
MPSNDQQKTAQTRNASFQIVIGEFFRPAGAMRKLLRCHFEPIKLKRKVKLYFFISNVEP